MIMIFFKQEKEKAPKEDAFRYISVKEMYSFTRRC